MNARPGSAVSLRRVAVGLALACSVPGHAQDVMHAEAVIAPLHSEAAVKPMLGAVVRWLPDTEVHYDQPERTLHFNGPGAIEAAPLAQLLVEHGFILVQLNAVGPDVPASPKAARTDDQATMDDAARAKVASIKAHPGLYQRMVELQGQRTEAP